MWKSFLNLFRAVAVNSVIAALDLHVGKIKERISLADELSIEGKAIVIKALDDLVVGIKAELGVAP